MCIIVYKPAGKPLPRDDILRHCFTNNPHGAGFMYRNGDKIVIRKGFMQVDDLLRALHGVHAIKRRDLAIHFRFATHGEISPGNTHPFPLTQSIRQLRALRNVTDCAIMHNGIISGLPPHKDDTLSDTMCFIKQYVAHGEQSEYIQHILKCGKFLLMDKNAVRIYGQFFKDNGIYYSNMGYVIYDDDIIHDCFDCKWYEWRTDTCVVCGKIPDDSELICKYWEYYDEPDTGNKTVGAGYHQYA